MNRTGKILNSSPAFPFYARKEDIQNALADLNRKNLMVNPSFVPASVTKWRMKREPVIRAIRRNDNTSKPGIKKYVIIRTAVSSKGAGG